MDALTDSFVGIIKNLPQWVNYVTTTPSEFLKDYVVTKSYGKIIGLSINEDAGTIMISYIPDEEVIKNNGNE